MPKKIISFEIPAGIYTDYSTLSAEGKWVDSNKIRFAEGFAEKIGGWSSQNTTVFKGIARGMLDWIDLSDQKWLGVGTHTKLYVYASVFNDVTPIRTTVNPMAANHCQ